MTTLFQKAKVEAPKSESKTSKSKVIVAVQVGDKIKDLLAKRAEVERLSGDIEMLEGDLKPLAREKFIELYKAHKRRPDSFIMQCGPDAVLVIVQDKYLKITEVKEAALLENKLGSLIDEKTVFSFDAELLEKHEKAISDAISKIKSIPDEEKAKLITATVSKSIKKGTIETLAQHKNIEIVFTLIEPVVQLKNQ